MTITDELLDLVDQLDEEAVGELLEYARWLAADEDAPLSEEERTRAREGAAVIAAGDSVTREPRRRQDRLPRGEDDADGQHRP